MVRPNYGADVQYGHDDDGDPIDDDQVNYIERVVGKLLYYARTCRLSCRVFGCPEGA